MKKHFPWIMAIVACLALWVSNGLGISGLSVFDEALLKEFGWTRSELKFNGFITLGVTGLIAPLAGILIDRYGVRICMAVGWVILTVSYIAYSFMGSLTDLYLIHVGLGVVLTLCGLNAAVILVSQWFTKWRGLAIGIALTGSSFGGAVMPQLGTWLQSSMNWRQAFQVEAIFPVIMLLVTLFIVRNTRSAEDDTQKDTTHSPDTNAGMSFSEAIRTRTFWAFCFIAMATFYAVLGTQAHLFLHMRDLEFDVAGATNAISTFFVCALVGKFLFGLLADHLDARRVMNSNFVIMIVGTVLLATMRPDFVWVGVVAMGFGWGGIYTLLQLNVINAFGLKSAGKILGTITVIDAFGGGLGIWLTGVLYEMNGSYIIAFQIFVGLIVAAMLAMTQIRMTSTPHEPKPQMVPDT